MDIVTVMMGAEVETVNIPFNGLFSAVQSGRIDIATSSITITDERLESVTFAQPYYDSDQSLTALAEGPKSLAEMEGKVVGVDTGSRDGSVAIRWSGAFPTTTVWDGIDSVIAVHGHGGSTEVQWLDPDES